MPLLLDTHVWIWTQAEPERLGKRAKDRVLDTEESLYVSTASTIELARLAHAGRLRLRPSTSEWIADSLTLLRGATVEVSHEIAVGAYDLPGSFHRDPVDRLLVSTARTHGLDILTADERVLAYAHVRSVDARR